MDRREHWEQVYSSKPSDRLGWYKPRLQTSLDWITALAPDPGEPIIDVGGGASTLVDDLLDRGYTDITVLDLAGPALDRIKTRLGERRSAVTWLCGDITEIELEENAFQLWHDRAVFHFLTEGEDRKEYINVLNQALMLNGHLIIATFGLDAPPKCSGLPVVRYEPETLHNELGDNFILAETFFEDHVTPSGVRQKFIFCRFIKRA